MSTHKHIDRICVAAVAVALIIALLFVNAPLLGITSVSKAMGYENRLFDTSRVHTVDIVIDDWDAFLSTAQSEEYSVCSVVIDGEAVKNVGIRGKGNTSLSSVSSMGSERYSFKIEFDQYDSTKTYHGLDKLCLNNLIQDNTYMKDYLVYRMMNEFGVAAPLCSFAYITVNGEDWGLYLAVEAVEESFLQRNYGSNYGDLYKPDSLSFGGGRGNGKDFDMSEFTANKENAAPSNDVSFGGMQMPEGFSFPMGGGAENGFTMPEGMPPFEEGSGGAFSFDEAAPENFGRSAADGETERPSMGAFGGFGGFGMGSSDVKLQYIDDDPESYSNIFSSAKTDVTVADQNRLIASLKQLSAYEELAEVVNIDEVLRYFVVHNFAVNADSYTGSMIHNYYLYEEEGRLSMIPWDYNLAFGTFMGSNASSSVNEAIDEVLSDRPLQAWIFSEEAYTEQYYELYAQMLNEIDIDGIIGGAYALIAPYVEKDPTAFCTYDEFEKGVSALKTFCSLRQESVTRQLAGDETAVQTGDLSISDMGTMGGGMGGRGGDSDRKTPDRQNFGREEPSETVPETEPQIETPAGFAQFDRSGMTPPGGASAASLQNILVLSICIVLLIAALLFAKFYKRRK